MKPTDTSTQNTENDRPWLNTVGGLGDMLILSGVLKQVHEATGQQYNLVRRTRYLNFLQGHPAIAQVGHPPKGAQIMGSEYWSEEPLGPDDQRPFQVLARAFGLSTPVPETLYVPFDLEDDPLLHTAIPWKRHNVLIAPASDSPRKMMPPMAWHYLVDSLAMHDCLVIQAGTERDMHIKGAYSVLGLTTPKQLLSLMAKCDAVVTSDNFIMHAAHLLGKPATVVWGPTDHRVYGYPEQAHFQAPLEHCPQRDACLGPDYPDHYATECPLGQDHCMNHLNVDAVLSAALDMIG